MKKLQAGCIIAVFALVSCGENPHDINVQRDFQPYETPIIGAAGKGHLDVVKVLVEAGADLETRNTYNSRTALFMAVMNRHRDVVDYLLEKGADPMTGEQMGKNVLIMAIIQNDMGLIRELVKYGAWPDPNVSTTDEVAGRVGLNALQVSRAQNRPCTGYLQRVMAECKEMLKTGTSCKRF